MQKGGRQNRYESKRGTGGSVRREVTQWYDRNSEKFADV